MDVINTVMNAITTDNVTWVGVGAVLGGLTGSVLAFWVGFRAGIREGARQMQKYYESASVQNQTIEMPAPEEVIEAEVTA